jgi:hypothetical protein
MNDENKSTRMIPHTEGKVPNMVYHMYGDYSFVDKLEDISGCMNDRRNKEGRKGAGI